MKCLNPESRIPDLVELTVDGMQWWFAEMSARDLIFHPEVSPGEVVRIADGGRLFDDEECKKLERTLSAMYDKFGDGVIEAAYPIFMKKAGQLRALDS